HAREHALQVVRQAHGDVEEGRGGVDQRRHGDVRARVLERQPRGARVPAIGEPRGRPVSREEATADVVRATREARAPEATALADHELLVRPAVDEREDATVLTTEDELVRRRRDAQLALAREIGETDARDGTGRRAGDSE